MIRLLSFLRIINVGKVTADLIRWIWRATFVWFFARIIQHLLEPTAKRIADRIRSWFHLPKREVHESPPAPVLATV